MKKVLLILSVCMVLPLVARAESYFGFNLGSVSPGSLDVDTSVRSYSVDPDNGTLLGLKVGHYLEQTNEIIGLEVEFSLIDGTDIKNEYAFDYPAFPYPQISANADLSIQTVMLNLMARKPTGIVHPYGGLGFGQARFKIRDVQYVLPPGYFWLETGTRYYDYPSDSDTCFAYQLFGGLQYDWPDSNLTFDIGFRFFRADPEFSKLEADTEFEALIFNIGLNLRF